MVHSGSVSPLVSGSRLAARWSWWVVELLRRNRERAYYIDYMLYVIYIAVINFCFVLACEQNYTEKKHSEESKKGLDCIECFSPA